MDVFLWYIAYQSSVFIRVEFDAGNRDSGGEIVGETNNQTKGGDMMRRFLAIILGMVLVLSACAPAAGAADANIYTTLYSGEVTTLNYLTTATTNEFGLLANLIDTLVEYDRYGQVQPSLAESWEVSEDGLTWTFHLREGVQWINGNAEAVATLTASDFVAAAKYILNAQNASSTADVIYSVVEGAEAYYDGTATPEDGKEAAPVMEWDTVGIKAVDELTLQYTLVEPVPYFLSMVTYVCFMPVYEPFLEEKGEGFGLATGNDTILYNGAYYISEFKPQEKRILTKNAQNWDADNIFIEGIHYLFNKEASTVSPELYLKGEVSDASIDSAIAAEWLKDPAKADYIRPIRHSGFYTYFYAFNFDPQFAAEFEPDNWRLAANNENFRKSIYYGLDRIKAQKVLEPDLPETIVFNTFTPPEFVSLGGVDYTQLAPLAAITAQGTGTFDEATALTYRDKAIEELTAAGATFPIKVLMPFNGSVTGWDQELQVIEQQLEGLFGAEYIDIIIETRPSTNFLSETRRSGNYALLKCNWGPDYADPQTYTDIFKVGNSYHFMDRALTEEVDGVKLSDTYYELLEAAKAITGDITARYRAFAEAEAFLINHAIAIPYGYGTGGYVAARINPFESQYAPFGISNDRFKGQHMLDHPMNTDEYFDEYDKWLEERAALVN